MVHFNMFLQFPLEDQQKLLVFAWEIKFSKCMSTMSKESSFDVLFYRNGVDVEGSSHKQVVDLIKHSGDELRLVGKKDREFDSKLFLLLLRLF